MYSNNHIFYPKNIYMDLNFDRIKEDIKNINAKYEDYGSIVLLQYLNCFLSVNNLGKIQIFYDVLDQETINNTIGNVETIFRKQITDFEILRN